MSRYTIQEKIELLINLDIKTEGYNKLYEEILHDLVSSQDLYSVIKKILKMTKTVKFFVGLIMIKSLLFGFSLKNQSQKNLQDTIN